MSHFIISEKQLDRLLPFYLLIKRDLLLRSVGKSIHKLCEIKPGDSLAEHFTLGSAATPIKNFDELVTLQSVAIELGIQGSEIILDGKFEYLDQADEIIFTGVPHFNSIDELQQYQLTQDDFTSYDPSIKQLQTLSDKEASSIRHHQIVDTLIQQKKDLEITKDDLNEIALFPMQSPYPLIRISYNGEVLIENPAATKLEIFEFDKKKLSKSEFFHVVTEKVDKKKETIFLEVFTDNKWYSFACVPVGEENYINIYGSDITLRKKTENEITRLSLVASANQNGVLFTTPDGKITWANEGFCRMTNYSMEEVIGRTPFELSRGPLTDHNAIKKILESFFSGSAFNVDIIYYRKDGSWFWGRSTTQPIKDAKGNVIEFFGIIIDITEEKAAEHLFRKTLETIGDNVWEHDFRTNKTYFSNTNYDLLGFTTDDLTDNQQLWWSRVYEEDYPILQENDRKYRAGLIESHNLEYRMVHNNGTIKWVLDRGVVIEKDEEGKPLKITGTHTDITEKKNAEALLEFQRKFYEDILNQIPADIAVFSPDHIYLFVNPSGVSDPELRKWMIGKSDEEYCRYRNKPMSVTEARRNSFNRVIVTKASFEWEEVNITPEGREQTTLRRWYPVLDENKEITQVIEYGLDITDRKQFEKALTANEEKYRGILANMNLGVMELDQNQVITYANKTLVDMVGKSFDDVLGIAASTMLPKDGIETIKSLSQKRGPFKNEAYEWAIDIFGSESCWLVSIAPNFNDSNEYIGSIVICLDITERKELEQQLVEAREKAELLAKTKEVFLANMSHEIRTPMNAIIGMSNQLAKTTLSENQKFFLNTIRSASDNLLVIINDILDLSKIEAGKLVLEKIGFEPRQIISHVMQVLMHKAEEKGLLLTNSKYDAKLANVLLGDSYRLNQVLLNLLSNAIKFTKKGSVDIKCNVLVDNTHSQLVEIKVIDTGIGMEKEFIEKLFDKFSQEYESMTRNYGGTGLGMSICQNLVELMGGNIVVESEKGKGTTVKLVIEFDKGDEGDLPEVKSSNITSDFLKNKTILVADDNEMNRVVASTILMSFGASIIEAINGQLAITAIEDNAIDLVLMDIQMPVMSGLDATREIRRLGNNVPIIALTANAIKGENEKCIAAGMNDYIAKPFKEDEFLKTIAHWLQTDVDFDAPVHDESNNEHASPALYSLKTLERISGGNKLFIYKMLKLFIEMAPATVADMRTGFGENDFERIRNQAHRLRPSLENLGIFSIKDVLIDIELNADRYGSSNKLKQLIDKVDNVLIPVVEDLKLHLKELTP